MSNVTSTQNAAGLLTPVYSRDRKDKDMPYAPKFEHALEGIAHGMKPTSASLKKISPEKARDLLSESKGKQARHRAQVRAVKQMSGEGR